MSNSHVSINFTGMKLLEFEKNPAEDERRIHLPIANGRNVYSMQDVEKRLAKLAGEYENLRTVYERMIERGPERFQVKPSGLPQMDSLYETLPNFTEPLDDIKRSIALALDSEDGLEVMPLLLLGPPGIGKTFFARRVADLLGTGTDLIPMSSMTAGWLLSGSSSQWKGSRPGKVFDALVNGQYANPVMVVDEVDKAAADAQYDPLGSLYSLLERDTSASFVDEFAEVSIDASQVIWVLTANDERCIPKPIMSRLNVFAIEAPSREEARRIARNLYKEACADHGWGEYFDKEPSDNLLDLLADLPPREVRRALTVGFGNARLAKRGTVTAEDLPKNKSKKPGPGFLN